MKLRNKKTGEIIDIYKGEITLHYNQGKKTIHFKSLEELEEWEDYEEPKECWTISGAGFLMTTEHLNPDTIECLKKIGNYFETKEEAEQAVEKLRAWKRLKEKNVFIYLDHMDFQLQEGTFKVEFPDRTLTNDEMMEADNDLDLLFGGEE